MKHLYEFVKGKNISASNPVGIDKDELYSCLSSAVDKDLTPLIKLLDTADWAKPLGDSEIMNLLGRDAQYIGTLDREGGMLQAFISVTESTKYNGARACVLIYVNGKSYAFNKRITDPIYYKSKNTAYRILDTTIEPNFNSGIIDAFYTVSTEAIPILDNVLQDIQQASN